MVGQRGPRSNCRAAVAVCKQDAEDAAPGAAIGGAYARLAAVAHDWRLLRVGSGERSMTEGDPPVDRDALAHSPGELPRVLPHPGDLFATLQRVIDATRAVFQVDGASLALAHEDGSLRWVVVTDGAAGLLEDTQRELGEGPGLAAYADGAAVT